MTTEWETERQLDLNACSPDILQLFDTLEPYWGTGKHLFLSAIPPEPSSTPRQ